MRALVLAVLLAAVAAPAHAQGMGAGIPLNQEKAVSPETAAKRRATEQAYKSSLKNIPDAKPVDPWGNMRGADTPAAAKSRPAAKKANGNPVN